MNRKSLVIVMFAFALLVGPAAAPGAPAARQTAGQTAAPAAAQSATSATSATTRSSLTTESTRSSLTTESAQPAPADTTLDEIAALLAGLPGDAPSLKALRETPAWAKFAESMDKSWADLETKRLAPMRAWAEKELFDARAWGKFIFYPFGGPDFMTAFELFPEAETYVLLGLEFCGRLPRPDAWKAHQADVYWNNLAKSLSDFFDKSYFITKHMDETLYGQVEGVLPIVAFFLKRTGNTILEIRRLEFDAQGEAVESSYDTAKKSFRPYGIKIKFAAAGSEQAKTILYVSCDLENKAFRKDAPFTLYLDKLVAPPVTTYLKSASYLLHYAEFSNIREMIMAKSKFVVQDDTGIPYKAFKPALWQVRLYGEYAKPIKDFSGVDQLDLQKAYEEGKEVIPKLPFHLGYHWRDSRDALLLVEKRDVPLPEPAPKKR